MIQSSRAAINYTEITSFNYLIYSYYIYYKRECSREANPELFCACNLEFVTMLGEFDLLPYYLLWSIDFRMILQGNRI